MTRALFDPITLRGTEIRNRIWIPPMCQYAVDAQDGVPTDWHLVHLGGLARGGAGAVVVEATGIVPEGRISPQDLGLWNDTQRDAFRRITAMIHSQGAKAGIQLAHAGRKASTWRAWGEHPDGNVPAEQGGWQPVGPSAIAFPGLVEPTELTAEDVQGVIRAFAAAARRAVDAGFDLLEVHGAHGYLLHEFLSPLSNQRTDAYGGSLENRSRALLETVDAMRAEVGDSVPIIVRLSATEWTDGGFGPEDAVVVSGWLREHGVDLVSVSTGGNVANADIPVGPGYQLAVASQIKHGAGVPVAAVGMIDEPFQAEQIVALGQADVVLVGREALRDPNFPIRAAAALRYDMPYRPSQYERAYR
ncbi:NADH:flavin oxidoreductase/NADH oxidase [Curtobacterium sp. Leaf261]|uniref:NADH:flavin oxidoreductase/NADH oxidase n=1 Tax=Curtobacterium sp. Leaf261 TaxID=1736311 RepID=UPI0006FE42A5|nr:NADH:flavin oxidoreductase/NADH oxidase [Curtobacterium sp. Leaf261]KQO63434.1 oxidoreductase [Curtobacterium sp. Leaf261]